METLTGHDSPALKEGHYYEITEDLNAIPRGIYRLKVQDDACLVFGVGKKIEFLVGGNWEPFIRPVGFSHGSVRRTGSTSFVERYYELLNGGEQAERSICGEVFTACTMDADFARELQ